MTGHTPMLKVARLDVISSGARRRWTLDEKQRIVAESYAAPRQVSATARRNGLSASQLFTWRRLARDGRLEEADSETTFAPVLVGDDSSRCSLPLPPEQRGSEPITTGPSVGGVGADRDRAHARTSGDRR